MPDFGANETNSAHLIRQTAVDFLHRMAAQPDPFFLYLPFQNISQRIKRKYDIDTLAKNFPVELNVFDIIYYDDEYGLFPPFGDGNLCLFTQSSCFTGDAMCWDVV